MLIICPECSANISDKAYQCPHCGYPLKGTKPYSRPPKRMRLPNGFGQISEIKGRNLRNPFRVMISVGMNENGRPIVEPLKPKAYFPTYNDAYAALVEQHKSPYSINEAVTLEEVYERWLPSYEKEVSLSTAKVTKMAWIALSAMHKMPVRAIKPVTVREFLLNSKDSPAVVSKAKILLNLILDYAMESDIVDRNCSRVIKLPKAIQAQKQKEHKSHISYTDDEIKLLWQHTEIPFVDLLLIQCYSGWRPGELVALELENINLQENYMTGGSKTEAGINRQVPIYHAIRPFIVAEYKLAQAVGSKYLFPYRGNPNRHIDYDHYKFALEEIIKKLNINPEHRPHDGRKHFVTQCKRYKVDEYAIKYMVGHTIKDLTESVYTDRDVHWLKSEIEKIKVPVFCTSKV